MFACGGEDKWRKPQFERGLECRALHGGGKKVSDFELSFQFEAINLTDEIQRVHGRTKSEVLSVTQAGPRYMIGARYKF